MTNDEDSKDMALFERTLKGAAQAAGILSKSVWSTIADRGGKRSGGAARFAQSGAAADGSSWVRGVSCPAVNSLK